MRHSVRWYLENSDWLRSVTSNDYQKWIGLNYATA
jgi:dTDP-D-glucose 4,6-dehydratase